MKICGLVVAGGQSTRMGAQDKLTLKLGSQTLVERAVQRLQFSVARVGVNISSSENISHGNAAHLGLNVDLVPDKIAAGQGPLAGVAAGLAWANEHEATHLALVPGDAPFFPKELINRLAGKADQNAIIVPFLGGYSQPLFSLWSIHMENPLNQHLMTQDDRKVMNFIKSQAWQRFDMDDLDESTFLNINTPDDWTHAHALFESGAYE